MFRTLVGRTSNADINGPFKLNSDLAKSALGTYYPGAPLHYVVPAVTVTAGGTSTLVACAAGLEVSLHTGTLAMLS